MPPTNIRPTEQSSDDGAKRESFSAVDRALVLRVRAFGAAVNW
jgi:hypothetical protein